MAKTAKAKRGGGVARLSIVDKGVTLGSFALIAFLLLSSRSTGSAFFKPAAGVSAVSPMAGSAVPVGAFRTVTNATGGGYVTVTAPPRPAATNKASTGEPPIRFVRFQGWIERPGLRAAIIDGERYTVGRMTPVGLVQSVGPSSVVVRDMAGKLLVLCDWRPVDSAPEPVAGSAAGFPVALDMPLPTLEGGL